MSVEGTLDRLSFLLRSAPGVPLSASCLVNRAELLALVEQALAELPPEVDEAHALLARRAAVLDCAQREADGIVADARRAAEDTVEHSAVMFRANARADEIVKDAQLQARLAKREADDWCDRRLGVLEAELERALGQVRRGRAVLEERLSGHVTGQGEEKEPAEPARVIDLRDGRHPTSHPAGDGADDND